MTPSRIPKVEGIGRTQRLPTPEMRLPNARARKDYSPKLDHIILAVLNDGGTGLTVDDAGALTGAPAVAGEMELILELQNPNGHADQAVAKLTVIPDPRDLWKSLPSDKSAPHWKPDEAVEATSSPQAFVTADSLRGRGHAQKGGFREDDFSIRITDSGWHIMVVADGAGSASMSRRASQLVCKTSIDALEENITLYLEAKLDGRLTSWLADPERELDSIRRNLLFNTFVQSAQTATRELELEASASDLRMREFSTTLLCAIARKTDHGWLIGTFSVGDGGAVAFDVGKNAVKVMCTPDSGEYAGQTRFLDASAFKDSAAALARVHCEILPTFSALALMTDGITDAHFPTDAVLEDVSAWQTFWE
jgi:serine/threonine protein phosphatase PrpC